MLPLSALDDANDIFIVNINMVYGNTQQQQHQQQQGPHQRITSWSDLDTAATSPGGNHRSTSISFQSLSTLSSRRGVDDTHLPSTSTTAINPRRSLSASSSSSSDSLLGLPPPYSATATAPFSTSSTAKTKKSKTARLHRNSRGTTSSSSLLSNNNSSGYHYIHIPQVEDDGDNFDEKQQVTRSSSCSGRPSHRVNGATATAAAASGSTSDPRVTYNNPYHHPQHDSCTGAVHSFTFDSQGYHSNSNKSWLMFHWQNICNLLKTSPAFRLLAYAILFFNFLIALRIMADPLDGSGGYGNYNGGLAFQDGGTKAKYGDAGNVAAGGIRFKDRLFQAMPVVMAASHNDEMQSAPFSEAMSLGFGNIEVDTWLIDGVLLAGHEANDLSRGKTLQKIYLDPLFKMLERANNATSTSKASSSSSSSRSKSISTGKAETMSNLNSRSKPEAEFLGGEEVADVAAEGLLDMDKRNAAGNNDEVSAGPSGRIHDWKSNDWNGVYPLAPKQDLMLMIDVKADPNGTFHKLREVLQPFIDRNYLTVYRDGQLVKGPLTIVGTGDTPLDLVYASNPRYIFYDAPLVRLQHPITIDGNLVEWGPELAPIASSKWLWWNYYPNVEALAGFSEEAHKRGIQARWWGVVRWPAYFRRALWNLQLKANVDWINADDLADVASFLRTRGQSNGKTRTVDQ